MGSTLTGRVAVVTGGARGIGAATAVALARRGVATALLVRDAAGAAGTVTAVRAAGGVCEAFEADVASYQAVSRAIEAVRARFERVDILINNAGMIDPIGLLGDTDPDAWARAVSVNLVGAYNAIRASAAALLASPSAAIVNVSSGAAHNPREGWSAYCSAKAGLLMLTRSVAHEYAARGLAVYGLQPGLVDTGMQVRIRASGVNEISQVPREQLAPPEQSAECIAWLADERPADLIGQDLSIRDAALHERLQASQMNRAPQKREAR